MPDIRDHWSIDIIFKILCRLICDSKDSHSLKIWYSVEFISSKMSLHCHSSEWHNIFCQNRVSLAWIHILCLFMTINICCNCSKGFLGIIKNYYIVSIIHQIPLFVRRYRITLLSENSDSFIKVEKNEFHVAFYSLLIWTLI